VLHQNVQMVLHRVMPVLRWSSGLRQLWPYPEPIALSHARRRWHDRGWWWALSVWHWTLRWTASTRRPVRTSSVT